jgi:hypothetical protein
VHIVWLGPLPLISDEPTLGHIGFAALVVNGFLYAWRSFFRSLRLASCVTVVGIEDAGVLERRPRAPVALGLAVHRHECRNVGARSARVGQARAARSSVVGCSIAGGA